ncbi:MAG TPA: NAD-dependent epimerase/dehydratase family protein [Thermodesulfobacteriota bacterium]
MADETVVVFDDDLMHVGPIEPFADQSVRDGRLVAPRRLYVPAFDPRTLRVELRLANALIKHRAEGKDAYEVRTGYGRRIRVTGDHSVFRRGPCGRPEPVPVRDLAVGDDIALPARLPVVERDVRAVDIVDHLIRRAPEAELWNYALVSADLASLVEPHEARVVEFLAASGRFAGSGSLRNAIGCAWRKYLGHGALPLPVAAALWREQGVRWPENARLRPYTGGGGVEIPNRVEVTNDLLWLLGLYLAEGCHVDEDGDYRLLLGSGQRQLDRARRIIESHFGVTARIVPADASRAPQLSVDSGILVYLFRAVFGVTGTAKTARVPGWIMQLPLARLVHFLEGYREGDGAQAHYPERRELTFNTVSEALATDLTLLLLRFGIVASVGKYATTFERRYGDRTFPFWRVTVCELSNFDILGWHEGVVQTLDATRSGDLVWAPVREIRPIEPTGYVYDFSVDGHENFVAGIGVFAHNTYGPRMRPHDGRVVPAFTLQALAGEDITVFGDGSQTRSFCYVDDLVEGIYRLLGSDYVGPVNIGNPEERTVLEFAERVKRLTGSTSRIVFKPLPVDDPKVRRPDISLARRLLGWEPRVDIDDGLRATIDYYRSRTAAGRRG